MYKLLFIDGEHVICILDDEGKILIELATCDNLHDAEFWCEKLNISYDIGYEHGVQLGATYEEE